MTHVGDNAGYGTRSSANAEGKRRRARRNEKRQPVDVVGLIDALFCNPIVITENGMQKRITGFGAILQMMWIKEMSGDRHALMARKKYEAFAREQRPKQPSEIIIRHGLPERIADV